MARASKRERLASLARLAGTVLFFSLAGCKSAAVNPWVAVPSAKFSGRAFGDTATIRTSIVALDTLRDVVVFNLSAPAHVIVLDVSPGKAISPLYPELGSRSILQGAGEHMLQAVDPAASAERDARAASEEARCIDQAERIARQRAAKRRPQVRRDSAGRVIQSSVDEQSEHDMRNGGVDAATLRACRARGESVQYSTKSARTGEHYLVVISSPAAYSGTELAERIASLAVTGSDVATTIEAIGAGLFVGRTGAWSGYYVSR
jgi:hypothetical protein